MLLSIVVDGSVEESRAVTGGNKVNRTTCVLKDYKASYNIAKIPSPAMMQTTRRFALRATQHGEELEP